MSHDRKPGIVAAPSGARAAPAPASAAPAPASGDPLDTLSDVLRGVRLTGALFFLVNARKPWVAEAPPGRELAPLILPMAQHVISYHLVTAGGCWCSVPGQPELRAEAGDVIVLPHGDPYALAAAPGARVGPPSPESLEFFRRIACGELPPVVDEGGAGPDAIQVVCSFLGCDALPFNPILANLPRVLHFRASGHGAGDRLASLFQYAVEESARPQPGSGSVLLRLSELMFVEVLRRYLSTLRPGQTGWLAGLRDAPVGRALAALHHRPAHRWTLEELAARAGLSRSALAERFAHFVGQPPMQYLAAWRMQLAARLLADGGAKVAAVAREVGYDSEAAFSRAFKKAAGVPPAAWRRRSAGTPEPVR